MSRISAVIAGGQNVIAWLDTLAHCEGTAGLGDDGYNVLVGGSLFHSYQDHPRQLVTLRNADGHPILQPNGQPLKSTAAGRYQILMKNYDDYKRILRLPDFSPLSQDRIALRMLEECKAMPWVMAGKISEAAHASSSRWASMPGNDYGQRQETIERITAFFKAAGGKLA